MASTTMVSLLLEAADNLVDQRPRSSAFKRRAVSTAYYAVFHTLAKLCADSLLASPYRDRTSPAYERIYRALNHGSLKSTFSEKAVKDHEKLRRIGDSVVRLQSERHKADYSPPIKNVFSLDDAKRIIAEARAAITEIDSLSVEDRLTLATFLLFKVRQQ